MALQSNKQGETQLLAEWLTANAGGYPAKTHVSVGATPLICQGRELTAAKARMLLSQLNWVDARVAFSREIWIIEAKIIGVAAAYGQVLDYAREYPNSDDYQLYFGKPIVPVVLCAFERPATASYFAGFGVRTVVYSPQWSLDAASVRIRGSSGSL